VRRRLIVEAAVEQFAEHGYTGTRMEDVAAAVGISKGSLFNYFGDKEGLFLAAYVEAASSLPAYLDAPPEVLEQGFFAVIRYWLSRTEHLVREDWVAYRVTLMGNYSSSLTLRREINRYLVREDPYGTVDFVRYGLERGELRTDVPPDMIVTFLDWLMERFQDALATEELDPGLFRRMGAAGRTETRVEQFMALLAGGIAAPDQSPPDA
jgi:TetR/AcrR family transcriptional regulator